MINITQENRISLGNGDTCGGRHNVEGKPTLLTVMDLAEGSENNDSSFNCCSSQSVKERRKKKRETETDKDGESLAHYGA